MKFNIQISLCSMLMVLGSLFTACEVIPEGEQDKVIFTPTDPSAIKRTSLLIEYSGWRCMNCPNAAAKAHELQEQYGEQLVVVVMHPESNPNTRYGSNQTLNYTCPEADSIYYMMGGTNTTPFPTGNVNMVKDATNNYFNDNDKWGTLVSQAYSTPKPMLLKVEATSIDTNVIFVAADITNIDTASVETTLQVWLTEDSVMGRQYMPDGTQNKNYAHNHLLRASITPVWGDIVPINAHTTQQVVYEYTLPEKVVKENCNIVALVSVNGEVVQATEKKITIE
jgi:hypothetical protein